MTNGEVKPDDFKVSVKSIGVRARQAEMVVQLSNSAGRALHYIADVRTTRYDPATRRLTLAMSDAGRVLVPSVIEKPPIFRHIDPGGNAELVIKIPERIIKLSRSAPPGELAFETHPLADIEEVVVDIAWSDVPYYKDTRASAQEDPRMPAARWEQHTARVVQQLDRGKLKAT